MRFELGKDWSDFALSFQELAIEEAVVSIAPLPRPKEDRIESLRGGAHRASATGQTASLRCA